MASFFFFKCCFITLNGICYCFAHDFTCKSPKFIIKYRGFSGKLCLKVINGKCNIGLNKCQKVNEMKEIEIK